MDDQAATASAAATAAPGGTTMPVADVAPASDREMRIEALLTSYAHGMDNNAPRTRVEFEEMKSLLGQ